MSEQFDDETRNAIRVLAAAVERERVHGIIEFQVVAAALDRALTSGDSRELDRAAVAFSALDVGHRQRIGERARVLAERLRDRVPPATVRPVPEPAPSATPFLAALNRPRAAPNPRSVARSRLLGEAVSDEGQEEGRSGPADTERPWWPAGG